MTKIEETKPPVKQTEEEKVEEVVTTEPKPTEEKKVEQVVTAETKSTEEKKLSRL